MRTCGTTLCSSRSSLHSRTFRFPIKKRLARARAAHRWRAGNSCEGHRMRKVPYILTRLSDEDVDWMATAGKRKRLPAGTVLIREGKPIEALTFVLDGV